MICKNCGAELSEGSLFCESCGARLDTAEATADSLSAIDIAEATALEEIKPLEVVGTVGGCAEPEELDTADIENSTDVDNTDEQPSDDEAWEEPLLGDNAPELSEPTPKKVKTKKQKALDAVLWLLIFALVIVGGYTVGTRLGDFMHSQRTEKTVDYSKKAEKLKSFPFHDYSKTFLGTIDESQISDDSFILAWFDQYQMTKQTASVYDAQYGAGMGLALTGFDAEQSPAEQLTEDEDGNEISFSTYFSQRAEKMLTQIFVIAKLAAPDFEMPDKEAVREKLNSTVEAQLSKAEAGEAVAAAELLKKYNKTKTANLIYQYEYLKLYAAAYLKEYPNTLKESFSVQDMEDFYKEHRNELDAVSFSILGTPYSEHEDIDKLREALKAYAEEENGFAKACEYLGYAEDDYEHRSELINYNYSSLEQALSAEAAEWFFAEERQVGDTLFVDLPQSGSLYLLKLTRTKARDESLLPTIRILPILSSESEELSPVERAEALVEAFRSGAKQDSESFAALVAENSNDEEMKANGGLIENMPMGEYITEIEEWAYSAERKPGDVSIVEFKAGAIVLYYVSTSEKPAWFEAAANLKAAKDSEEVFTSAIDNAEVELDFAVLQASIENSLAAVLREDEEATTDA